LAAPAVTAGQAAPAAGAAETTVRRFAGPILLTILFVLAVVFDTPRQLRGPAPYPPEWQWGRRTPTDAFPMAAMAAFVAWAALLLLTGTRRVRQRPGRAAPLLLAGGTVLGVAWALALLAVLGPEALPTLAGRVMSPTITSYHTVAVSPEARDPLAVLRRHAELLPTYEEHAKHAATHPPGAVLLCRAVIALCERSPGLTRVVLEAMGQADRRIRPPHSPASKAAALLVGLLFVLLGTATAWPVAALAARLNGDRLAGVRAGLLWPLVPGAALMTPELDQALALPVAGAAALLAASVEMPWMAVLAGLAGGLALLMSYGAAALLVIAGVAGLAAAGGPAGPRLRRAVTAALVAAAVLCLPAILGHPSLQAAAAALRIHRQQYTLLRSYGLWLFFNPLDGAVFLGAPVAALLAARGLEIARRLGARPRPSLLAVDRFTLAAGVGLAVLCLSGVTRGEVGRLWLPVIPLLLVAAVARPAEGNVPAGPTSREAVVLGILLASAALVIRIFWDV
jgi:hypothetical protein